MHSETHSLANEHNFKVIACRHLLLQLQQHCFDSTTVFLFVLYVHLIKSNNIIQTHYKNRELLKRREWNTKNNIKKKEPKTKCGNKNL